MNIDASQKILEPLDKQAASHCPVLLNEVIGYISPKDDGCYLDCTFGAGGYTRAILNKASCFVTSLDRDPTTLSFANKLSEEFEDRFQFIQTNFADAKDRLNGKQFDGIVLDLGISSMQVDSPERGFSFMRDGVLDMRMDLDGVSAVEFVANSSEEEIANVIYKYGQEVQSRQIAKAIVEARQEGAIDTTLKLADIVRNAMHYRKGKIDPVTKTFQAIRIHVNKELESLERFLAQLKEMLKVGGRILVVSFHSLEDGIVKSFLKEHSAKKVARSKYAKDVVNFDTNKWLKIITKKPVTPSRAELLNNSRSRSSRLRVAEKIDNAEKVNVA